MWHAASIYRQDAIRHRGNTKPSTTIYKEGPTSPLLVTLADKAIRGAGREAESQVVTLRAT
jgi:hypothetical protein